MAGAGGRQGGEAEAGQQARRTDVPGIGNDEGDFVEYPAGPDAGLRARRFLGDPEIGAADQLASVSQLFEEWVLLTTV
ncbi:MAG: hypothetical protein V3T64_12005 [Myxococcota bacterium]